MKKLFISMLDSKFFTTCLIAMTLCFVASIASAQNVQRKGNTFVEQRDSSNKGGGYTKTEYTYIDSKGVCDTVYLSKNGSAFVFKVSKKTGKTYRKYLPKVTEQLGTKKEKK